jgi:hypothetical protein
MSIQKTTTASLDPKDEIQTILDVEAEHVKQARHFLGERARLATDVLSLYDLVMRGVDLESAQGDEESLVLVVMLNLLAGCRFQMTMGVLQNWRGHSLEALASLRRAVELCGAACHIRRNPGLAAIWSSASNSDSAYKENKGAFGPRALFPKTDPTMVQLFEVFDTASKVIHCSIYSLCGQVQGGRFNYFDTQSTNDPTLIRTFFSILSAHELILAAFIKALDAALKDNSVAEKQFRLFAERLQRHRGANLEYALSDLQRDMVEGVAKQAARRRPF